MLEPLRIDNRSYHAVAFRVDTILSADDLSGGRLVFDVFQETHIYTAGQRLTNLAPNGAAPHK
jgi:hypothetical protein